MSVDAFPSLRGTHAIPAKDTTSSEASVAHGIALLNFQLALGMRTRASFEISADTVANNFGWKANTVHGVLRRRRSEAVLALEGAWVSVRQY